MNLDELRSAQSKERRKDSLQHLRDSFYDDVAAYVSDLRAARDRRAEQVEKPFSDDDVRRMSDEVETAEEVAEALYERRVGKVVKLASFAAADMSVDTDGMTTEERQLFDDLVDRISTNKSRVLDVLAGDAPPSPTTGTTPSDQPSPASTTPSDQPDPANVETTSGGDKTRPTAEETQPPPSETNPVADETNPVADETNPVADETSALTGAMGGADNDIEDPLDAATQVDRSETETASPVDDVPPDLAGEVEAATQSETPTTDGGSTAAAPGTHRPETPETGDASASHPGTASGTDIPNANTPDADAPDTGAPETNTPDTDTPAAGASADATDETAVGNRTTVRITRDVGAIFGVDEREYDLTSEDVVSLPAANAEPLVQRDAAEKLD